MPYRNVVLFSLSLLSNKTIARYRVDGYVYNGKSFDKPTGLKFDTQNLHCLRSANNNVRAVIIKDYRSAGMHWSDHTMTQYYFDKLWNFFEDLLKCVGLIFAVFVYFKCGGFIMPDQLVKSFGQIMKRVRERKARILHHLPLPLTILLYTN